MARMVKHSMLRIEWCREEGNKFGRTLEQSAKEILAHLRDEIELPVRRMVLPHELYGKQVRTEVDSSS